MRNETLINITWKIGAIALALFLTTLVLIAADAPPLAAYI